MNKSKFSALMGLVVALAAAPASHASDVSMTAGDGFGASSFNSAGQWNSLAAPVAGNDYFNATFLLRTPADANSYAFAGDSLTITGAGLGTAPNNEAFMYKGSGVTGTITVNNLVINGGQLRHAQGDADTFNLAGTLAIGANGATIGLQGALNVSSSISGSGTIRILDAGNDNTVRTATFTSGANTFDGSIELYAARSRFALAEGANLNFDIGASGVNNSIFGIGVANLNGIFNFDLSGAGVALGDSWTIVDNSTIAETFGPAFSVSGFSDLGGDLWGTSANGADYLFSELTGMLTVVPEPSSGALLVGGLAMLLGFRRVRKV